MPTALPIPSARHLAARDRDRLGPALQRRGRGVFPLVRRDADLGAAVSVHRRAPDARAALQRWQRCEPVYLPGVLGDAPDRHAGHIAESLAMFERLRDGADFLDELEVRLADDDTFRYAGSTVDRDDPREIERVFVDALSPDDVEAGRGEHAEPLADELWAKLAWITADDPSDRSLRIRFSNGLDQLEEWMTTGDRVASYVDLFARRAFPECEAMLGCRALRECLDALLQRPYRLSERIVYNNAPNGGAIFHHDAEPGQLGVAFAQLEGRTAWFALPKRRLARLLERRGFGPHRRAMRLLDQACDPDLLQVLNRDERFARVLAAHGALFVLEPGDAILLPSHGIDDVAWHSVLAVGDRPSLAHSYGLFARGDDYEADGDPWLTRSDTGRTDGG